MLADTLSWASLDEMPPEDDELQVNMVERSSITEAKYAQLHQSTANELHELHGQKQSMKSVTVSANTVTHVMNWRYLMELSTGV